MALLDDIERSRQFEMQMYLESTWDMYSAAFLANGALYDIAFDLTRGFGAITAEALLRDSRIIKTLRYAVAPSISQMKLGQFVGLGSVDKIEQARARPGSAAWDVLQSVASQIAAFSREHLDSRRFPWLDNPAEDTPLARQFARSWTCSIAADQNSQTEYRHWRKRRQESAVIEQLRALGFTALGAAPGIVTTASQIPAGRFAAETRVQGRTTQKADVVFRSRSGRLVLVEAKAVGVLLDATKRVKECSDKASDWRSAPRLGDPQTVAVIAGFFSSRNVANLESSGVGIVWEHDLAELGRYA